MRILTRRDTGLINRLTFGSVAFDSNAEAFITAAGITNETQQNAINTLVINLKAFNLWNKMSAIYPFVGGTATTHKFNLKDPRDLDAAYRLSFIGGWTHSANGALPNGTNGYADTFLAPSTIMSTTSGHQSSYFRTSNPISAAGAEGAFISGSSSMLLYPYTYSIGWISDLFDSSASRITTSTGNSTGFIVSTRASASSHKIFRNNTAIASTTAATTGTVPNINYYIGAANASPASFFFSNQYAFKSLGIGLTDAEASNLFTSVQSFQTILGRQI